MKRPPLAPLLPALPLLLCASLPAQTEQTRQAGQVHEGLLPFRRPSGVVEEPKELFHDLRRMVAIVERAKPAQLSFDERGREVCDDPAWRELCASMQRKLYNMATVFGMMLRDSASVENRALSAYGSFWVEDPAQVCELIAFFPGEPERSIRQDAFRRAIEFLRVHLPQNAPAEDDRPPVAKYTVELYPYVALIELEDVRDQAQGLWFLEQVIAIRRDAGKTILEHTHARLRALLISENDLVRTHARAFLRQADPKHRAPPAADASDDAVLAWLAAVVYDVFPPIRQVSSGLIDLYPSEDLDRIVEVGTDVLRRGAIGVSAQGQLRRGALYRGFRVQRLPEPLDQLKIPVDAVITAINGKPVAEGQEILAAVTEALQARRQLVVEYVHGDKTYAMEYRLR